MLTDNYNRIINYVRVSVTDRCNLRCRYCVDRELPFIPHESILRYEEIVRFVRICAGLGVKKVRLTGGEPLVRKGIAALLRELNNIGGIEDISITTNGVFLGDMLPDLMAAGLKRVNISLDTMKRDRFAYITGVDDYERVLKGIQAAHAAGLNPIKINTVIIKGFNDDEILQFARNANKWDVHVRFIEFMPFGDSDLWSASSSVPSAVLEEVIRANFDIEAHHNGDRGPAKTYRFSDGSGSVGFISPMSTHICSECNRIRLTSEGMLRPCLFSDIEFDVRSLLRNNAGDEEVRRLIQETVKAKPERKHEIGYIKKCQRDMRHIGG